MITKYLNVGNDKWGVLVCYDYDLLDYDDMWALCRSFGLSNARTDKALRVLSSKNTGMTVSNEYVRMSAVFVSDASDESEWWSTLSHELWHVATAIIDYYDEPYDEEPAAYLYGELMRMAVNTISTPCYY